MGLFSKLITKNIKLNKKRTIISVIGIILSVALITALSTMVVSTKDSLIKYEKKENGNFHYMFSNVPVEDLTIFNNNRNIESYFCSQEIGFAKIEESKNKYKPYAYVMGVDSKGLEEFKVNLLEGRMPENEREIVIPSHLKSNGRVKYNIGDIIKLNIGIRIKEGEKLSQEDDFLLEESEDIINKTEYEYKVVGIIERPSNNIEQYSAPGFTFITYLAKPQNSVTIYTRYQKSALKNADEITANILNINFETYKRMYNFYKYYDMRKIDEQLYNDMVNEVLSDFQNQKYAFKDNEELILLEGVPFSEDIIRTLLNISAIVVGIIMVTSILCIRNLFLISTTEKIKQYGMLSSIGATKHQIRKSVLLEAGIMGLIGIPIGLLSGIFAAFVLIQISNSLLASTLQVELNFSISLISILAAIILSVITIYLSALKSAKMASKLTPLDAIRNSNELKVKAKKLKCPKIIKKLFGMGGVVSYKNMKRNKRKYRTTALTIFICVVSYIPLTYFVNMGFRIIGLEVYDYPYDISVYSYESEGYNEETQNKIKNVIKLEDVTDYTISSFEQFLIDDDKLITEDYKKIIDRDYEMQDEEGNTEKSYYSVSVVILEKESYEKYIKKLNLNYKDVSDKAILINDISGHFYNEEKGKLELKEMQHLNVKEKDIITGFISSNENEMADIQIAKITNEGPIVGIGSYSANIIICNELFDKIKNQNKNYPVAVYLKTDNATKLHDEIDEYLTGYDYMVDDVKENANAIHSLITLMAIFLYGFITVIALIGITNVINTINTSMELRSREFATLKSLGMTRKEFYNMINLESLFVGTKGLFWGIIFGTILSLGVHKALTMGAFSIPFKFPIGAILASVVVVYGLLVTVMNFAIRKINKKNIIETIRNENI